MSRPKIRVHRLDLQETRAWWFNDDLRRKIATHLRHERYAGELSEIVIVGPTCVAIGIVSPAGAYKRLEAPQPRYPMWRVDNQPDPASCHCAEFYEPDIAGPWRLKRQNAHHRFCQYHRHAVANFNAEVARDRAARPEVYDQIDDLYNRVEKAELEAERRRAERGEDLVEVAEER